MHLVFVAKYRRHVFTKQILSDLRGIFGSVCKDFEAELVEVEGEKVAISKLVNSLKGVSSRLLRKKQYPSVVNNLWGKSFWSPSYFAGSCGGATISLIRQYIEQQKSPY